MNRKIFTTTVISSSFVILLFYFGLTTGGGEKENYKNSILNHVEIFAQEENKLPVVKNSKIIEFSGIKYADVVNSRDVNLNGFTVSARFNTAMNVTGRDVAFLINKGGFGTDRPGFNLNYGIWLDNREKVSGGFEASNGDDYLHGKGGDDKIDGGEGDDRIFGGPGNNELKGEEGNDVLNGERGNDELDGGDGNDKLKGGRGDDKLDGGTGNDELDGGMVMMN